MQHNNPMQSMVLEAWVPANCVLTPSLILHNLALHGIHPMREGMAITIDRGHYDCTDTRYAVIVVQTRGSLAAQQQQHHWAQCSLFSRKAAPGMDATALYSHWLGNGYMRFGDTAPMCSYRYEPGHAKTWRRSEQPEQPEQPDQSDAVSVDPVPIDQNSKNKHKNTRVIQLQKKNFLLRTELDALKSEFKYMKAELVAIKESLGIVKEDQVGLAQRHKEQETATKRANQCMQDWMNKQLIERVCILETQQQQPQQTKQSKKFKSIKRCMKRMSDRLDVLENTHTHANANANETISWNPFDFKTIFDYAHYDDLIVNHYDEPSPSNNHIQNNEVACDEVACDEVACDEVACDEVACDEVACDKDACDEDDMFEVIRITPGSELDLSYSFSLPK